MTPGRQIPSPVAPIEHPAVLDASPNAIVAVDAAGVIVYANPQVEPTFGWSPAELIGQTVDRLVPERVSARHAGHRAKFAAHPLARPMGVGLDLAGRRKDGSEFPVEISLSPVNTPEGPLVFATIVDITTRKALEAQLLEAQKMESVGRLAGGIAHDFNNMLFAIRGYAELLVEDIEADSREDVHGFLINVKAIQAAADRAAELTSQLLAFSRRQVVESTALAPAGSVTALEPMLRRLIGENVDLVLRLDPATGAFRGNPAQFDQILMNLVVNARDALPAGRGRIAIETANTVLDEAYALDHLEAKPGPYVMIAVSDTGMGMDAETKAHAFEPFFTTKERGTGLGLATIYGIVRQAAGFIWLYSEPGHGTTVKIYFPRLLGEGEQAFEPAPPAASGGVGRVLVVEDEDVVRDLTTAILTRAGYEVVTASNADVALSIIEREGMGFDALVSDVVMPGVSGLALAEQVMDRLPRIGVVLLSGYTAETLGLNSILARGAVFLSKPVTRGDLTAALEKVLAARRP